MKTCLTIAGSDSGGGAGIQADLKAFHMLGCFGTSAITCLTAQNTQTIKSISPTISEFIGEQIDAILEDIPVHSVKIGMLLNSENIKVISKKLLHHKNKHNYKIVLDTVMVSKSGLCLLNPGAIDTFIHELIPLADVLTPNIPEASVLLGHKATDILDAQECANLLLKLGPKSIILKGGHSSNPYESNDLFYHHLNLEPHSQWFKAERIQTKNSHGTGCTFSSAICAFLAKNYTLEDSIAESKKFITAALYNAKDVIIGHGQGPANSFVNNFMAKN